MHVWEQERMGLHAQEIMAMAGAPLNINACMHSLPSTCLESYSTMFSQNIQDLDSCICHCEKTTQTTVKPKCDNVEHVNFVFFNCWTFQISYFIY